MCTNDELSRQIETFSEKILDGQRLIERRLNEADEERKEINAEIRLMSAWQNQMKGGSRVLMALCVGVGGISALILGWLEFFKR